MRGIVLVTEDIAVNKRVSWCHGLYSPVGKTGIRQVSTSEITLVKLNISKNI